MNSLWLVQVIWRRRWLLWISATLATFFLFVAAYLFHRTLRFLNDLTTVALWLLAAVDSAETLAQRHPPAYERKLAFWVLARLWTVATWLPMVGDILRLFTAPAFAVFLAAPGEILLRRVMLPLLTLASTPVRAAVSWLTTHCGFGSLARLMLRVRHLADFAGSVAARHAAAAETETDTMPDEVAEATAVAKDEVPGNEEGAGLEEQRLTEPVTETTGLEDSAADRPVPDAGPTLAADDGLEDVVKSASACSQPSVAAGESGQQPSPGMSPVPSSSTIAESDQQASEKAGAPAANGLRSRTGRQKKTTKTK